MVCTSTNTPFFLKVSVSEGGSVLISHSHFDSTELLNKLRVFQQDISVTFHVVTLPHHGNLFLDGVKVTSPNTFTQDDIDAQKLRYNHDDSDTTHDVFAFSVDIQPVTNDNEGIVSPNHVLNFSIEVIPVNNQRPDFVTLDPSLPVLQGGQASVTSDNLLTHDPDTVAADITYTIQSGPTNGRFVRHNLTAINVESFTQQEINDGALVFLQDGIRKNGEVYFRISDGKFLIENKKLNIIVIPVEIDVSRIRPVQLVQSESPVFLSRNFLNVTTNGNREDLVYKVTSKPRSGQILVQGGAAEYFSQQDVDTDSVLYVMHNFSASEDSFQCDLSLKSLDVTARDQTVRIVVKPLISQVPLVVAAGATVAITKTNLDVSELATRTGDNPTFEIIRPPRHGQILRKLRKRRDLIAQPVEQFTFEDIVYAKIFYVSNARKNDKLWLPDSFSYELQASNAQPAIGKFLVNSDVSEGDVDGEVGSDIPKISDSDPGDHDSSMAMIVGVVLGVLLVLIIVAIVLVILWRRRRAEEDSYDARNRAHKPRPFISGPLQLEQPHVHIEPQQYLHSPGSDDERCLMRHSSNLSTLPIINVNHDPQEPPSSQHRHHSSRSPDLSRTEISAAVPDCKVTPLVEIKSDDENPGSEPGAIGDRHSGMSSASTDLYDWTLMDPELLQHCRTETPVLKGSQYWV